MILPTDITDEEWSLAISGVTFGFATVMVWRGAALGAPRHAKPRVMLAVILTIMSANFVADLASIYPHRFALSVTRAAGWLMALALAFTAATGIRYGRKVQAAQENLERMAQEIRQDREGS